MKRVFFILGHTLVILLAVSCMDGGTAVPAINGPALLFFYTDN